MAVSCCIYDSYTKVINRVLPTERRRRGPLASVTHHHLSSTILSEAIVNIINRGELVFIELAERGLKRQEIFLRRYVYPYTYLSF